MMSRGSRVVVVRVKCLESKAAALDLVAVDTGVELLEVGLVFAWDEGVGDLDGFPDSHVGGDSADLAGNAFHAALALDDGVVDVGDALKEGVGGVDLFGGISLPSDGGKRNIGWEEE